MAYHKKANFKESHKADVLLSSRNRLKIVRVRSTKEGTPLAWGIRGVLCLRFHVDPTDKYARAETSTVQCQPATKFGETSVGYPRKSNAEKIYFCAAAGPRFFL